MKKLSIFFLTFVFATQTLASDIWVGTPNLVSRDQIDEITEKYRPQVKDGDFVSSFDFLIGHPASQSQMAIILDLDSMARADALNGLFAKAFSQYLKLEEKLKKLPDVSGLEKIELSTRVSLAHMATMLKSPKAEDFWREAHAWAPQAALSPEEFSPAVILQFSKSTAHAKKVAVQVKSSKEAFIFVDGERLKKPFQANLEPGHHQVSALTAGAGWTLKNFEVKESRKPIELSVLPAPFVKGTCQNPKFVGEPLPPKTKLLVAFDEECARIFSDNNWRTVEGVKLEKNSLVSLSDDLKPGDEVGGTTFSDETPKKKSFISKLTKSGWFWAGVVGVVVVGAAAVLSSNNKTTTVPTHTVQ
jgi:hypothetical protein